VAAAYRRAVANDLSRPAVGQTSTSITATNYLGLSGSNVLVEVNDTGIDSTHPDFLLTTNGGVTRVVGAFSNSVVDIDGHGTHVAGIIAGNGAMSTTVTNARGSLMTNGHAYATQFRGKAPDARLYSVGFLGANDTNVYVSERMLQEIPALTNALISNNSWRYTGDNEYDLPAASYDAAMRDALPEMTGPQPVLFVFAGGNEGGGNDAGSGGSPDSIASPATAKNVITVGALEEGRNITNIVTALDGSSNAIWTAQTDSGFQVAGYSSRGNVGIDTEGAYGRFKPDVVAPGTFTISTRPSGGMWDEKAFYNITNYHGNTVNNDFVKTNTLAFGSFGIPINAVSVSIQIIRNNKSPNPLPTNFPIYVSRTGIPNPAVPSTYDIFKTGTGVAIPPDSGGTITDISILKNGGISYAIGDPYTNKSITFDVVEMVVTTNDLGNQLEVMSNLNNSISGAGNVNFYRYESGTSMATPAVSGVLACMQDFFTNRLQTLPSPALLKAMLINGARVNGSYKFAVTNTINYQGWGLVKLSNSIPLSLTNLSTTTTNKAAWFVDQSPTNALATGGSRTYNVTIPSAIGRAQPMRVTLAWTDPPGNPAAALKLVNDLDLVITNLGNGQVFRGNNFSQSGTPPFSVAGSSNSISDNINNVENIYLSPTLGTNYSITVYGKAVNVNAVTLEQTNVVQDFALVITSGDGNNTNGFSVTGLSPQPTTTSVPHVDFLPSTNGIYFNQIAGANAPWLNTNDLAIAPAYGFFTNSVFHVGQLNQWHFYVVTNTFAATNSAFTNAAFIIFLPATHATPREGVFEGSTDNSTRTEADLEMLVASAPDVNAALLTNLNFTVVSNCLFNTNGCGSAIGRGGSEFVVFSNSTANQIYYIGVQCQDQMAGQYAFVPIFSDKAFSTTDSKGNVYVNGLRVPQEIPDGNNAHPGVTYVLGLCLSSVDVGRVIVTNTFNHENFGDLFGGLSHENVSSILNNHDGLGPVTPAQEFIYDDSARGDIVGVRHTDGPGSLNDFRGKKAIGVWLLNEVDNSYTQTGAITGFQMKIEPHRDLRKIPFSVIVTVPPQGWFYDYIDVPVGYTNLLVVATNLPPTSSPPIVLAVKQGDTPTLAETNYITLLTNCAVGTYPTGTLPGNSVSVGPPLVPDRYFVGLYNPDTVPHDVLIGAILSFDASAVQVVDWNSSGVLPLKDDAVTYDYQYVTDTNTIFDFQIGLRVDHPRISDLVFHLTRPDGTRYLLMENRGGTSTNGCGVTVITTNIINQTANGGSQADTNSVNIGITHGTFPITYNFYTAPDEMTVYYGQTVDPAYLIYDTGLTNNPSLGGGAQNTAPNTILVSFPPPGISANSTYLTIVINQYGPSPRQTAWVYTAGGIQTNYAFLSLTENTNLTTTPIKFAPPPFVPVTYTNYFITTNITFFTNAATTNFSTLEATTAGSYTSGSNVDSWLVASNQVSVVNDPTNASGSVSNSRFMALAAGTVRRTVPTVVGVSNVLRYAYRGPGALAFWRGDNNATDSVGSNNGFTTNGANFVAGKVNQAFNFNGAVQFVKVPAYTNMNLLGNRITIDFWMFANSNNTMSAIQGLVDTDHYGVEISYGFGGRNGVNFYVDTTSGSSLISSANGGGITVTSNVWHHIAGVYDGTKIQLYIDGVPAGNSAAASGNLISMNPSSYLGIGSDDGRTYCGCGGRYFWGLIDEPTLYKRDLSASEIKAIYNAGIGGKYDSSVASPQNLAKARASLSGVTTNLFYGANTNWQTNTIVFVATTNSYTLQLDGLAPGMLLDSFVLSSFSAVTNYVTNAVVVTSNLYYLPEQDISSINGTSPEGRWTLEVLD
ncbi:MAG: hypothetical protein RL616_1319, partial [Verrucomicrobiota bacterium]